MNAHPLASALVFSSGCMLLCSIGLAQDDVVDPGAAPPPTPIADTVSQENPRNRRFDDLVIEYVWVEPRAKVLAVGDGPKAPTEPVTLSVSLCNLRASEVYAAVVWGEAIGMKEIGYIGSGEVKVVSVSCKPEEVPFGQEIQAQIYNANVHRLETTDSARLYGPGAMRVALLFESATFDDGNSRFGSALRRVRQSFDDFNDLLDVGTAPAVAGLKRSSITDRFRIDSFDVYKRADLPDKATRPALFDDHPEFDLVIAMDEDGPLSGYWPARYSIGHNFHSKVRNKGLWSDDGEQSLWRDLLRFRGAIDFNAYRIAPGAARGHNTSAIELDKPWRESIMADPYQHAEVSALTAAICNANAGVSRLGDTGDSKSDRAYAWKWIPEKLTLSIVGRDGKPMVGAPVRWYRAWPDAESSNGRQAVAPDRKPDGSADTLGDGTFEIQGDDLKAPDSNGERSRWLLVEIEDPATKQSRYAVVSGLWINAAYAGGQKQNAVCQLKFTDMSPVP